MHATESSVVNARLRVALAAAMPLLESDERKHRATAVAMEGHGMEAIARAAVDAADARAHGLVAARAALQLEPDPVADLCERHAMAHAMLEMLETCRPEHAVERIGSALAAYRNGGDSLTGYIKLHGRKDL
jgi:hypothetical protein